VCLCRCGKEEVFHLLFGGVAVFVVFGARTFCFLFVVCVCCGVTWFVNCVCGEGYRTEQYRTEEVYVEGNV